MSFGSWKTQGLSGLSIIVILSECYLQKIEHIPVTHALTLDIPRKSFKRFVDGSHVKFGKREQSLQLLDIIVTVHRYKSRLNSKMKTSS